VLLLNTTLTVAAHKPNSHAKYGWNQFTDAVIKCISINSTGIIFILWGSHAQQKANTINTSKHYILKAAHPSFYSADKGFFGCKHFSRTNKLLEKQGKTPVDWNLA
jgi:uracil-DNA glycosylase